MLADRSGRLSTHLAGLPVVVTYMFQEQARGDWLATTAEGGAYLPIRCGHLVDAFREGQIAHFYFSVDDYVRQRIGRKEPRKVISQGVRFRTSGRKGADPSYAHLGQDFRVSAGARSDGRAFQEFVDRAYRPTEWRTRSLGSRPLDVTYDPLFFRVTGVYRQLRGQLVAIAPRLREWAGYATAEYPLEPAQTYIIGVSTYLKVHVPAELPGLGTARLALRFDPAVFRSGAVTSLRISSPYDLEQWTVETHDVDACRSTMTVRCLRDEPRDRGSFMRRELICAEIALPVVVSRPEQQDR
jgi:hypothetical protein